MAWRSGRWKRIRPASMRSVLVAKGASWFVLQKVGEGRKGRNRGTVLQFFFVNCWSQNDSEKDWVSEHRCGFLGTNVD